MYYADLYLDLAQKATKTLINASITDEKYRAVADDLVDANIAWAKSLADAQFKTATLALATMKDTDLGKAFRLDKFFNYTK